MNTEVIETLPNEAQDLGLHVQLCEQRYVQLINKIDRVEEKFDKLEKSIVELKDSLISEDQQTIERYLKWAGIVISILASAVVGLVLHIVK